MEINKALEALQVSFRRETMADNLTSGTAAKSELVINVRPDTDSTRVLFGDKVEMNWISGQDLLSGGWLTAQEKVVNLAGQGVVDKVVVDMAQVNIVAGRANAVLGYEAEISSIAPDASIGSMVGFYFPNLENVPNLDKIEVLAAFANQHRKAIIQNMGVYCDADLRQVVAPQHIGMSPNRYYTAPYRWLGYSGTTPGVVDLMPIFIPERTKLAALGVGINSNVAGAKGRIALYTAVKGAVGALKAQTAELDLSTAGAKEGAVDAEVEGGMYWLALNTSAAVDASSHAPQHTGDRAAMYGQSNPLNSDGNTDRAAAINVGGYGAFPGVAAIVPTFLKQDSERHLWLRVQ